MSQASMPLSFLTRRSVIRTLGLGATSVSIPAFAAKARNSVAGGSEWPQKPVKIIVPFAAGGGTDFMARLIAQRLTENLDMEFAVENKAGVGGIYGTDYVFKSANDGYTMLVTPSSLVIKPALYSQLAFDPTKDFQPVMKMASSPIMIAARVGFEPNTAKEFFEYAKKAQGSPILYSTEGVGTVFHMVAEGLKKNQGLMLKHTPFQSGSQAVNAAISGEVALVIDTQKNLSGYIKSGKLKPLLIMSKQRSDTFPNTFAIGELGYPGSIAYNDYKVFFPAQTNIEVVKKLNGELVKILTAPEMKAKLASKGTQVVAGSPSELQASVEREVKRWKQDTASYKIKT
jgi:tripartite-type tricarboxylate transporter receptor subunit TctC